MKENDIIKDRYELLRPLGAGGFGEVWLAKDQIIGTDCALKFYVRLDDKGREEFRDEYRRMLGIHDAHLLTASYYDEWQGRPFLVMDYCGGGAASGKVGQLSETELWQLIRDVASGLVCLHGQSDARGKEAPVIHQDIKPANFLQKGDGTWLISDFGISSRMRSSMSSQSGREVSSGGTIPYMGPERFGQDQDLVKASDIWALGASIYEMAKGKVPFGAFGGGTQRAGAEIPHLPKERWSSDLDRLVSSCLQKETWDRPSAALVAEYADSKLKGKPLPRLPKETPKWWKWVAAAGAVVAVALVIVLWPNKPPIDPDTQAFKSCHTVADYRAYLSDYGDTAKHYVEAKKFIEQYVDDSIKRMQQALPQQAAESSVIDREYVDLDLPSGTLWATCNIGASSPEEYGNYYAWGETSTKNIYDWSTYKYANGDRKKLTKYCSRSDYGNNGFTDNLTELQASDDPAKANWGSEWRMPSEAQWDELLANTTDQWTTKNSVKGHLFTSKKNGQSVFLPAAGRLRDNELEYVGSRGYFWSRSLTPDHPSDAWNFYFVSGGNKPKQKSQSNRQLPSLQTLRLTLPPTAFPL